MLSQVKLIAEPWDLGEGGYQVGNFPIGWTEWNGKYRDTVRRFWRGDGGVMSEMATRLAGSSDLYEQSGRRPYASINFITAHDGFTLADLVSYDGEAQRGERRGQPRRREQQPELELRRRGRRPTTPRILALRQRQMRNFMATLFTSQGVQMLSGGDEVARTQQGNNNAYCQDNEISWTPWDLAPEQRDFFEFTHRMIHLWRTQPVLRRRRFLQGRPIRGAGVKDIAWLQPSGQEMTDADWNAPDARRLGFRLAGDAIEEINAHGRPIVGDTLLILFNADTTACAFTLPKDGPDSRWELLVDTADPGRARHGAPRNPLRAGRPGHGRVPPRPRAADRRK